MICDNCLIKKECTNRKKKIKHEKSMLEEFGIQIPDCDRKVKDKE